MSVDKFLVESGHIMLFARAIGETDPRFFAALDGTQTGVPAPPTFVQASAHYDPDYPLRPKPGQKWSGSGADAGSPLPGSEEGGTGLHAEQHFEYHKPVTSGMVLTATTVPGRTWTKEGRRGGSLQFNDAVVEYRDQAGDLVVTARMVGVRTQKVVGDPT